MKGAVTVHTMKDVPSNCEYCINYEYDEDYDCYVCTKDLDEDEMAHFLAGHHFECPYFQYGNEYTIVKKQM